MILFDIWQALDAGKELKNPAQWKQVQNTANKITVVLSVVVSALRILGVDLHLTDEQLIVIAGAFAALLGVANSVLTAATTKKIGFDNTIHEEEKK